MRLRSCVLLALPLACGYSLSATALYTVRDLGTLREYSVGTGLNNLGQVTGYSGGPRAFLYSNGQMADLGSLGGGSSTGTGINDAGQVTGYSDTPVVGRTHAFLYNNGQMIDLGTLPGGNYSVGYGINNAGQVTGGVRYSLRGPPCISVQ
jgi:probable HAF family extracellular repeat protein